MIGYRPGQPVGAVVFDCDGVILDSNAIKSAAFAAVTQRFGPQVSASFADYHRRHGGISRHAKFAWLLDTMSQRIFVLARSPALKELMSLPQRDPEVLRVGNWATAAMMVPRRPIEAWW